MTGVLVVCTAADQVADAKCACGTVLSTDRLSVPHRPSGLVGRVLASGHTVGEPIIAEQDTHGATAARASAERWRSWAYTTIVTRGHEPSGVCVGVSQWHARTTIDEVLMGAGHPLQVTKPVGGGDAVTTRDVAAGAGRGVAVTTGDVAAGAGRGVAVTTGDVAAGAGRGVAGDAG